MTFPLRTAHIIVISYRFAFPRLFARYYYYDYDYCSGWDGESRREMSSFMLKCVSAVALCFIFIFGECIHNSTMYVLCIYAIFWKKEIDVSSLRVTAASATATAMHLFCLGSGVQLPAGENGDDGWLCIALVADWLGFLGWLLQKRVNKTLCSYASLLRSESDICLRGMEYKCTVGRAISMNEEGKKIYSFYCLTWDDDVIWYLSPDINSFSCFVTADLFPISLLEILSLGWFYTSG